MITERKKISVLVSTANNGIKRVRNLLLPYRNDVEYVIAHQLFENGVVADSDILFINRSDVNYIRYYDKGLSKNRNFTIRNAEGEIGIVADDDVKYFLNSFDYVIDAFEVHKDADVIVFQIASDDENDFKNYHKEKKWLSKKDAKYVNSIEITFRIDSIRKAGIIFNEKFGLGSELNGGEETLFILNCINKGLKVLYLPQKIVIHPKETSGRNLELLYTANGVMTRGANNYIHFGLQYRIRNWIFLLRHYSKYKDKMSFLECYKLLHKGSRIGKHEVKLFSKGD